MEAATSTVVLYEAPHRILEALADLQELLGDRNVVVARELTKIHEEFLRGTALSIRKELVRRSVLKGEFVVLVGPSEEIKASDDVSLSTRVGQLESEGQKRMDAIKQAARERGITKRAAYASLHRNAEADS